MNTYSWCRLSSVLIRKMTRHVYGKRTALYARYRLFAYQGYGKREGRCPAEPNTPTPERVRDYSRPFSFRKGLKHEPEKYPGVKTTNGYPIYYLIIPENLLRMMCLRCVPCFGGVISLVSLFSWVEYRGNATAVLYYGIQKNCVVRWLRYASATIPGNIIRILTTTVRSAT